MANVSYSEYLRSMPVNPVIAAKVLEMVQNQDVSFRTLEQLISADPVLTAKIFRIANSAMYARQNRVTRLQQAMTLLGIQTIKNVVILVTGTSVFRKQAGSRFYAQFWKHSLATAFVARDLCTQLVQPEMAEEAFIAGLLHNIGQAALYLHDSVGYEMIVTEVTKSGRRYSEMEQPLYGTTHREIGHEVLTAWNFPAMYADCAREHGNANIVSPAKRLILTVSVAAFVAANWYQYSVEPKAWSLMDPILSQLGYSSGALEQYQANYRAMLEADSFYKECQNLIEAAP